MEKQGEITQEWGQERERRRKKMSWGGGSSEEDSSECKETEKERGNLEREMKVQSAEREKLYIKKYVVSFCYFHNSVTHSLYL